MLEICTDAIICYGWVFEANMDRLSFQKLVNFFNLEIEFDKESKYTNCIDYPQFSNICKQLIIKFDLFQKENKSQAIVKCHSFMEHEILIYYPIYKFKSNYSIFEPDFHMFTTFLKRVKEQADKDVIFEEIEKITMIKPSCFIIQEEDEYDE